MGLVEKEVSSGEGLPLFIGHSLTNNHPTNAPYSYFFLHYRRYMILLLTAPLINYTKWTLLPFTNFITSSYENPFNLHGLHTQNMLVTYHDIPSHYLIEHGISLTDPTLIHITWSEPDVSLTTQFLLYFTCPLYPSILTYDIFLYSNIWHCIILTLHRNLPPTLWK
jgi:hypothetical protein